MNSNYRLSQGSHPTAAEGRCAMEWVAYIANEPHSDQPVCVSPVLRAFGISWNDSLDDETRQKLRPYLARMIGTAGDGRDEERAWMCTDWLVRVCAPTWMDLTPSLREQAAVLRALPPVLSVESARRVSTEIMAARHQSAAAGDAARDAAGDAAWDAAWDAAGDAAWAAARDAAGDAAGDAAWDAARAALTPTVAGLQASALLLLDRMIEVGRASSASRGTEQ
jgi:hypothetical protein